ncbi:MAG: PDZ domain-containing protein, partial [bacterium]
MTHSGFRTLLAGIGIRVETNESGEFVIDHVHRNGAAERNGNVKHGDVIDTIDGRPVNGLKLSELGVRCLMRRCIVCLRAFLQF